MCFSVLSVERRLSSSPFLYMMDALFCFSGLLNVPAVDQVYLRDSSAQTFFVLLL